MYPPLLKRRANQGIKKRWSGLERTTEDFPHRKYNTAVLKNGKKLLTTDINFASFLSLNNQILMAGEEEGNHIDPLALTPIVVDLKIKSEDAENILKKEMDSYMKSEKMVALNKKAEDSRLEYELKKSRLTELMIDNDVTEIKEDNRRFQKEMRTELSLLCSVHFSFSKNDLNHNVFAVFPANTEYPTLSCIFCP